MASARASALAIPARGYYPGPVRSRIAIRFALALTCVGVVGGATEQTVTVLTPLEDQRIEAMAPVAEQQVQMIGEAGEQGIDPARPAENKTLGKIGKGALAVVSLGVSLGFTVASLLFF